MIRKVWHRIQRNFLICYRVFIFSWTLQFKFVDTFFVSYFAANEPNEWNSKWIFFIKEVGKLLVQKMTVFCVSRIFKSNWRLKRHVFSKNYLSDILQMNTKLHVKTSVILQMMYVFWQTAQRRDDKVFMQFRSKFNQK